MLFVPGGRVSHLEIVSTAEAWRLLTKSSSPVFVVHTSGIGVS